MARGVKPKQPSPQQVMETNRLQIAAELVEENMLNLHPVRLMSNMVMAIPPQQSCEFWGHVNTTPNSPIKIVPRSQDWLPANIRVRSAEVFAQPFRDPQVRVVVDNTSKRQTVKLSSHDILAELHLMGCGDPNLTLEALVGPSCESSVQVNGIVTKGLLDSGSQVTVMSESFYREHCKHQPLEQPDFALEITGAGGQPVPYLGCVQCTVKLPAEVGGTAKSVDTFAVVCPDTKFAARVPIIVGTNTLRTLSKCCVGHSKGPASGPFSIRCEVAFAYQEASSQVNGRLCAVKLTGQGVVVPPHSTRDLKGWARHPGICTRDAVLVQEPTLATLPDGLEVFSSKAPISGLPRVKVTVVNRTDAAIKLKKNQVIADLFTIQAEYAVANVLQQLGADCAEGVQPTHASSMPDLTRTASTADLASRLRFGEDVDPVWREHFTTRLLSYADVFNLADFDIGRTDVAHDIELTPGPAVRERPRPIPPQDLEEVRQHIQSLLDANIIKPSSSPFASPIVLIRKKSGQLRLCVDYRKINARTVRDSYAIPKIEDLFRTLGGAKFFTSVDLSKAYYQVPLTERAKKISAFVTPLGLFEFERLSFGMVNAPSTFQRLMEQCFKDMNLAELIIFLDDVLVHAETLELLEDRTIRVLERLRSFRLKLDPDKCVFGVREVRHLGFLISGDGVRPDPDKIESLASWPEPTTVKEVKSFLGFCGFYRRWVGHFSSIVKPLNAGYIPAKTQKKGGKKGTLTLSSNITHLWGEVHQTAFDRIIAALTTAPVLGIADPSKPYQLHCDASGTGLGAVLYQTQEVGRPKVIAYASRGLNKSEVHYPAHKREFLALKWSMSEKFHDYLLGAKVTVYTDNNPLCYVLGSAKLDAVSHRWLASLSIYDFDLVYKRGSTHLDADGLSRRPQSPPEEDEEFQETLEKTKFLIDKARAFEDASTRMVDSSAISGIMIAKGVKQQASCYQSAVHQDSMLPAGDDDEDDDFIPAVETIANDPQAIPDDILLPGLPSLASSPNGQLPDWSKLQMGDRNIALVKECLKAHRKPQVDNAELKVYSREMDRLTLKEGVLYRRTLDEKGKSRLQLVVPRSHRKAAMKGVHEDLFHTHFEDAARHARMRFFWPFMASDLERKIKHCERCVRRSGQSQKAPMETIVTTGPMELLSIDFLTIEVKGQKQNILVMMDHFTKYAQAVCTKDQSAKTVARVLWDNIFMLYGFPERILSDQGRDFESKLVKELCQLLGISKCRTTPYHPAGNPVERWNRTLINMLRSLEDGQKTDWRRHLKACVHAYNSCIHQSTGFSPHYLFYGRHPKLPIDLAFGVDLDRKASSPRQYIRDLKRSLQDAYRAAGASMNRMAERNKARYDVRAHAATLEPGDRCLVRKMGPRVKSKVDDRWEKDVYAVLTKTPELPVYTVQREDGEGPKRTLHRNLLLPVGALGLPEVAPQIIAPVPTPPRAHHPRTEDEDSEEEEVDTPTRWVFQEVPESQPLRPEATVFFPTAAARSDPAPDQPPPINQESEDEGASEKSEDEGASEECPDGSVRSEEAESAGEESNSDNEAPPGVRRSTRVRRPVNRYSEFHANAVTAQGPGDVDKALALLERAASMTGSGSAIIQVLAVLRRLLRN